MVSLFSTEQKRILGIEKEKISVQNAEYYIEEIVNQAKAICRYLPARWQHP
jgi:hypothetical protein